MCVCRCVGSRGCFRQLNHLQCDNCVYLLLPRVHMYMNTHANTHKYTHSVYVEPSYFSRITPGWSRFPQENIWGTVGADFTAFCAILLTVSPQSTQWNSKS